MLKYSLPGHLLSQNLGGTTEKWEKPICGKDFPPPASQVHLLLGAGAHRGKGPAVKTVLLPFQKFPEYSSPSLGPRSAACSDIGKQRVTVPAAALGSTGPEDGSKDLDPPLELESFSPVG